MINHLKLVNLCVDLGNQHVIDNVSFHLESGQIGSLLGPSGCGKTTLLKTIAGFEQPKSGSICLRNRFVSDSHRVLPAEKRKIGMVFQDLALFPHLTVFGNVSFGIRYQPNQTQRMRVYQLLELVNLSNYANNYPHELSGGQQQRVALIRAIAPKPDILLLDEPLSGQDTETREKLAVQIRHILQNDEITALLVTHDKREAFVFSDRIGVMNNGHLHQWDDPFNLYYKPVDHFVADFISQCVMIRGTILDDSQLETELGIFSGEMTNHFPVNTEVDLLIRPNDVLYDGDSINQAIVESRIFRGADNLYTLVFPGSVRILCVGSSQKNYSIGEKIGIKFNLEYLVVLPREKK